MKTECIFCSELSGSKETNFSARYPEISSRIIHQTDNLVAFPCIGQITENHFLIATKKHFCTFNHCSEEIGNLSEEIFMLAKFVHDVLGIELSNSIVFEHGAFNELMGGCGIYHAHIHVVPTLEKISPKEIFNFSSDVLCQNYCDTFENMQTENSYVQVGDLANGFYFEKLDVPLPSQTLRKNLSSILEKEDWDWRNAGRENSLIKFLGAF